VQINKKEEKMKKSRIKSVWDMDVGKDR